MFFFMSSVSFPGSEILIELFEVFLVKTWRLAEGFAFDVLHMETLKIEYLPLIQTALV